MTKKLNGIKRQGGFTLIELSIVLVIIGLIVGGVLVGQEMIKAAEMRGFITQIEKISTAINTFRGKYNGLPGDLSSATNFFTGATNGDANGVITDTPGSLSGTATDFSNATGEVIEFFVQLSLSGLLEGATLSRTPSATPLNVNFPITKFGRAGIVPTAINGANFIHVGMASSDLDADTVLVFSNSSLTPNEAGVFDLKTDDGIANSGGVTARTGTSAAAVFAAPGSTGDDNCLASATAYNMGTSNGDANTNYCQLRIRPYI